MIERNKTSLCCVVNVMCDARYTGKPFADAVKETIGANVEIVKRDQPHEWILRHLALTSKKILRRALYMLDTLRGDFL